MAQSNKPIIWSLFAAGGTFAAFVTPVMILVVLLSISLDLIPARVFAYDNFLAFVQHPLIKIGAFITIFLPLWHAAHRLRITAHDFGIRADKMVKTVCYGLAFLGTIVAIYSLVLI